eukprot:390889-Rhodomonas_salina.2
MSGTHISVRSCVARCAVLRWRRELFSSTRCPVLTARARYCFYYQRIKDKKLKDRLDRYLRDPGQSTARAKSNPVRRSRQGQWGGASGLRPGLVIADEGHVLRNHKSNISIALAKVISRRRAVLTGTTALGALCAVLRSGLCGTEAGYAARLFAVLRLGTEIGYCARIFCGTESGYAARLAVAKQPLGVPLHDRLCEPRVPRDPGTQTPRSAYATVLYCPMRVLREARY